MIVYIGAGTNVGDRRANLAGALDALARLGTIDAVSNVYESEPVGYADQPVFWNLVVRLRTALEPLDLRAALEAAELRLGRRPTFPSGPRVIDLDLLFYGDERIDTAELEVPHPRVMERAFVLRPLGELDPDIRHPVTGERILDRLGSGTFERAVPIFPGSDLLTLLVALVCVVCAACRSGDEDADAAPPATAEEQGSDPALTALADTLLPGLERISRLEAVRPVVVERRSAEQVRAFVEHQLDDRLPADELEGFRGAYALLGLVPDSLDLRALMLDLYTEQIVGYYDPEAQKLFVVEGVPPEAVRPVLAHELVHALQDQHTSLDSLIAPERGNDRQLAAQAAIEGHATLVMFSLLAEEASNRRVDPVTLPNLADQLGPALESPSSDFPVFRSAPRVVRETLLFPYSGGARFVQELWRAQGDRRAAPIDSLLPQSTEQVLEPVRRFIDERDEPTDLRFDDGASAVYENGLGQLELELFLEEHLGVEARRAAEGWDGDRYQLLRSADGAETLVWYSVWDDDASADRFHARLNEILEGPLDGNGTAERISIEGRPGIRAIIGRTSLPAGTPMPAVRIVNGG